MKRKYNKKSHYWNKFDKEEPKVQESVVEPSLSGENYYVSEGSTSKIAVGSFVDSSTQNQSSRIATRKNKSQTKKFANIAGGMLPYGQTSSGINVRETIELCQKAYANIPIFRNAIDVMSEFSNSEIFLEGGSESANNFIYKWFEKINLWKLKDQYFREYYRSGNIFIYRLDGNFSKKDFKDLSKIYGADKYLNPGKIPIRYVLLNPYDITTTRSTSFGEGTYKKILSEYEIEKLKNPKTPEDKSVFDSLDEESKKKIKQNQFLDTGIYVNLDPEKLIYSFYKKQDYEPFAIPFGFPVLDDLNWKIELKKIDQAISRTIENVVLLITMGAEPDKGGINPHSLTAMQNLFKNESVGRVLVSDYTTKADFIIPDVNKILGPEKYEIVNQDIREGLQNIIVGKENYSSTQIKAQIFLERLKEARNAFINDFIMPQVKVLCKSMGFKKYPTVRFQEVDIKDEVQFQRVITRLLEIGIISPEQGIQAIRTGLFPHPKEMHQAQEQYIEERNEGLYNPLIGGVPNVEHPGAEEERKLKEKQIDKTAQVKQAQKPVAQPTAPEKETGRPTGATANLYSRKNLQGTIYKIEELRTSTEEKIKKHFNVKNLNESQSNIVDKLIESVVASSEQKTWKRNINSYIKDINKIESIQTLPEILSIASQHQLGDYPAAILYHSKK
jgi:hypothetical protein